MRRRKNLGEVTRAHLCSLLCTVFIYCAKMFVSFGSTIINCSRCDLIARNGNMIHFFMDTVTIVATFAKPKDAKQAHMDIEDKLADIEDKLADVVIEEDCCVNIHTKHELDCAFSYVRA